MKVRFLALDVFRGGTVALMILVNNPGSWDTLYSPLDHAPWHGCSPTDLVFPFFLFAVGNSLAFGMPGLKAGPSSLFFKRVLRRAGLIFLIGLLLNLSPFVRWQGDTLGLKSIETVRVFGVLQRISLAYLAASLIIYATSFRALIVSTISILIGYWLLSWYMGETGSPYSLEGFWGTAIDRKLLAPNHIYKGEGVPFDPEGLVSTLGSIPQVIIGYLAGRFILAKGTGFESIARLFVYGTILVFLGFAWDLVYPINKKIWTSSYVLYTSGIALLILPTLLFLIQKFGASGKITSFFSVFGKNPLFIFVLSGFLPRLLALVRIPVTGAHNGAAFITPFGWFYKHLCVSLFSNPYNSSLFYAICMVGFYWIVAYLMDRNKIYVRV